ncbi:hypothetical protein [Roseateles puraquae]|nr:hypothetical protein [Roseateles puraquae]MDG0852215.1 hypothetical protein [Roseateles puraquae]
MESPLPLAVRKFWPGPWTVRRCTTAKGSATHPDGECDAARAILATLAAQVAAAPVLIAALRSVVGSGSLPPEVAQAARDALAAAGG